MRAELIPEIQQITERLTARFDRISDSLDRQGKIEENMLMINRDLILAFDNFLIEQNLLAKDN